MRILVVGLNYAPEKVGVAVYTTGMAETLAASGHDVHIIAGQPYYPAWEIMDGHSAWTWSSRTENGVKVVRVPHYIPRRPSGLKRVIHHATFALSALIPALRAAIALRPEVVLTVAPSLVGAPVARFAAWVAGARSWLHVQDFEVEAAFATGLLSDDSATAKVARTFEAAVLRSFDHVSAISPAMCRKLLAKGVSPSRVTELRNWVNTDIIWPLSVPSSYRMEWNITTKHVALYSGNIANKQGIEILLEAASKLARRQDLTFVVCGDGPNRETLEQRARGLTNIQFHSLQPKERLGDLLGLATVHLLPQIAEAADLVLPSKLGNMLASGRPVVATAATGSDLHVEVQGCGITVAPGDSTGFAEALELLLDNQDLCADLGANARSRALSRWNIDKVLTPTFDQLLGHPMEYAKATPTARSKVEEL